MKTILVILLAAAGLGFTAFGTYYSWHKPEPAVSVGAFDELEWLRREFDLPEAEMARMATIHAEYRPICDDLCDQVIAARKRLEATLLTANSFTPELEADLAHFAEVKKKCQRFMLEHVFEVANSLPEDQRERYLARATQQITLHDPSGHSGQ